VPDVELIEALAAAGAPGLESLSLFQQILDDRQRSAASDPIWTGRDASLAQDYERAPCAGRLAFASRNAAAGASPDGRPVQPGARSRSPDDGAADPRSVGCPRVTTPSCYGWRPGRRRSRRPRSPRWSGGSRRPGRARCRFARTFNAAVALPAHTTAGHRATARLIALDLDRGNSAIEPTVNPCECMVISLLRDPIGREG
jgi:hypothetical protein